MKILSVVGARPQFIKVAPFLRHIHKSEESVLVHTGQHYDENLSAVFFDELGIPKPDFHLGIGSGTHGAQTGAMLAALEQTLLRVQPDAVVVFGDTNSTLAGALAAAKLGVAVAHVEAGLRSFNRKMAEEINRVATDHISDILCCPSEAAAAQLAAEGRTEGVYVVGDLMRESYNEAIQRVQRHDDIIERLGLSVCSYLLLTVHRAENTENSHRLRAILEALSCVGEPVVFPVHPRTRQAMKSAELPAPLNFQVIDPVGYLDMVRLQLGARMIVTDSGGLQKEAYWSGTPCVTVRDETEWTETVERGWNVVAGTNPERIVHAIRTFRRPSSRVDLYDNEHPSEHILAAIVGYGGRVRSSLAGATRCGH